MSLRQWLILGVFLSTGAAAWNALFADRPGDHTIPDAMTCSQLQAQLSALEERIKALEDQLTGVRPAGALVIPAPPANRPYDPSVGRVPPNWGVGEINGLRFYTAPLSAQSESRQSFAK